MLGPLAGGFIVGYFHWRAIFLLNIPVGIAVLMLVYLRLPDYREKDAKPLDVVGLILFGSGIALLSYVLEIFGEHACRRRAVRVGTIKLVPVRFRHPIQKETKMNMEITKTRRPAMPA
jgi:MFS family permease